MTPRADAYEPELRLVYTPTGWVGWRSDNVCRGGYFLVMPGLPEPGNGHTVDEAVKDLAGELCRHVLEWDDLADTHACARASLDHVNQFAEPRLVTWARALLFDGTLMDALQGAVGEAELDPLDRP